MLRHGLHLDNEGCDDLTQIMGNQIHYWDFDCVRVGSAGGTALGGVDPRTSYTGVYHQ